MRKTRSCSPASVRNYIKRYPSLGRVVAEVVEQNLDLAEHKLPGMINEGNMTAVIFYLKTKGRRLFAIPPLQSPPHIARSWNVKERVSGAGRDLPE